MGRVAGLALVVVVVGCGVARGADGRSSVKNGRWDALKRLSPGALIEVLREHQAGPDSCRISSVDDSSLTCLPEGAESEGRLVFPRSAVRDVWVVNLAQDHHIWISVAIGFALGAMACGSIGPAAVFICGGIGALIAAGIGLDDDQPRMIRIGYPEPIRVPRRPQLHRRLLYHAP